LISERLPQNGTKERRGWHAIVGTFENDPIYEEAMRLGGNGANRKAQTT